MKCSELYRLLLQAGWRPVSQKGSHIKMTRSDKPYPIIFPNHGSREIGKGLEMKIRKDDGI